VTVFFMADNHFSHVNILKFCNRPFANVREMDAEMVRRWNEVVRDDDVVYHLGDFTLGANAGWFRRLRGTVKVVPGGHDKRWLRQHAKNPYRTASGKIVEVLPPLFTLEIPRGKRPLVVALCHYPMLSWDRSHHGSIHLHGHSHGKIPAETSGKGVRIDVGVDVWNFRPVSLGEVEALAERIRRRKR